MTNQIATNPSLAHLWFQLQLWWTVLLAKHWQHLICLIYLIYFILFTCVSLYLLPQALLCCQESSACYAQTQLEDAGGDDFQCSREANPQTLQHLSLCSSQEHFEPFPVVSAESSAFHFIICIPATHIHADFLFSFSASISLLLSSQFCKQSLP